MRALNDFIYRSIEQRRAQPEVWQTGSDLLSILLRAAESGEQLGELEVRDEMMSVYFAGHETTAQAMTWTWYALSEHPEVLRRVENEVAEVLSGRTPTLEDVAQLTYTRQVVEESLRLYPPVFAFARDALEDDAISGYRVPKGAMVIVSPYVTHRHPEFWPDPERFDPNRFEESQVKARPKFAYFPFAGGHHVCIGNNFALLEQVLVLASVCQRYRLRHAPGHKVEIRPMITLRSRYGMLMHLEPRT